MTTIILSFRVRPLNNKEIKSGDEMVVQFPGDGQIYVSMKIVSSVKSSFLSNPTHCLDPSISKLSFSTHTSLCYR